MPPPGSELEGGERPRVILRVVPPPPPAPPPPRPFPWASLALAIVLVVGGAGLGWTMIGQSLADAWAQDNPAAALKLRPHHVDALARKAELALEAHGGTADALTSVQTTARQVLGQDPLDGSAFRSLAFAAGLAGDTARQQRLMIIAGDRMKRDIPAVSWLVANRLRTGHAAEAVDRADGLLRAWPVSMRYTIGSQLTDVAGSPAGAVTLARLLDTEPPWRTNFLIGIAQRAPDPQVPMALFTAMSTGRRPPTQIETGALVTRLVRDGRYQEAFLIWAQLLPAEGIRSLADPYDGGFEGLPGGPPFNWSFYDRQGVVTEVAPNPDGEGNVLYLRFTESVPPGVLARQLLALTPGRHVLTGRWKGQSLTAARPLTWTLRCAERGVTMAGTGPPLSGTTDWTSFTATLDVPPGCSAQWFSLSAPGRGSIDGEAWFDDLRISRGS